MRFGMRPIVMGLRGAPEVQFLRHAREAAQLPQFYEHLAFITIID